jgi:hypothetical protein
MPISKRRTLEFLESRLTLDSTVVFNEIMYHPANDGTPEWIELHNQMAVDMDVSGWKLTGGVNFTIPAGTVIPRQGYLVLSADPAAMLTEAGYGGALGPWVGSLDNSGERVDLENNSGRLMNRVEYDEDGAWPVGPDGTGATLAKSNEEAASDSPASWATSAQTGGTPGRINFPPYAPTVRDTTVLAVDAGWRYHDGGVDLGTNWKDAGFNDQSWSTGTSLFYDETAPLPGPKNTPLTPGRTTYYFRTQFTFTGDLANTELRLRPIVDDGAIYYLNGVEVHRQNMPAGAVNYNTLASGRIGDANFTPAFPIPAGSLVQGTNVLAVEVHQGPASAKILPQNFAEYNTTVNGYQDLFEDINLNPGWTAYGSGTWTQPGDGYLHASSGGTDPSKLLFTGASYNGTVQNVLAMVRVTAFGTNGDSGARAGVATVSSPTAPHPGEGINYIYYGNGNGIQQSEFLNDYIAHGPRVVTPTRAVGADYWIRLLHEPNKTGGGDPAFNGANDAFAKIWPADGTTPEPVNFQFSWASNDTRSGLAGLTIGFDNTTAMDVGYILIRAAGLPSTQITFETGGGGPALDDVVFGAELVTRETLPDPASVRVALNEMPAPSAGPFWVELVNFGSQTASLDGVVVANLGAIDAEHTIAGVSLAPGERHVLTAAALGFQPAVGDRIVLYMPGTTSVLDAAVVADRLRGRSPEATGAWRFPTAATPGAANAFSFHDEIVINEVMYHARPQLSTPGTPATYQTTTLVPIDAVKLWRYRAVNSALTTDWYETEYTTGNPGWQQGPQPIGYEPDAIPIPIRTQVPQPSNNPSLFIRTYYFQTDFDVADPAAFSSLQLKYEIDDGAVFYLNGEEAWRYNMPGNPGDPVLFSTQASTQIANATFRGPEFLDVSLLRAGRNVLSVEVHQFGTVSTDIVFAAELAGAVQLTPPVPGTPYHEVPEEWIELYNRSAGTVDLSGWKLKEAVQYEFPAGTTLGSGQYLVVTGDLSVFQAAHSGVPAVGPFGGSLSNRSERILLDDAVGNPADEVAYFDGGRWSDMADGTGASLELRDPDADNTKGEAWAASDEGPRSTWQSYSYTGPATNALPGAPTLWQEFAFGMLDGAGEVLIDDVSVIETPNTTSIERIQNGNFSAGASHWRVLGNHQRSQVIAEPGNPGNMVLRVVAEGPTEYQGNQIETTFGGGAAIVEGREYRISFRAKWVAGSRQINSRLYFARLARTTTLDVPSSGGTPGAVNSRRVANIGPTYDGLIHSPAVPAANTPVIVSVAAADPDNIAAMSLKYSVSGGAWQTAPMTAQGGRFAGTIPGQAAATLVQFYIEGQDALGAISQFPADGPSSRALVRWNDGQASTGMLHNFRILMTQLDTNRLHYGPNTTSNQLIGGTVIYNESEIFYDIGVHLKGSFVGRDVSRTGFHISFNADQLFRGVHDKVAIDRSETVFDISPTETLIQVIGNHAGGIPSRYDDLVHVIAPRSAQTSVAHLRMAGYDELFLDETFENGSDGNVFDFETPRWATSTIDGNPESIKNSGSAGNGFTNVDIQNLGDNKETYRWTLNLVNNRTRDDYSQLIALAKAFSLTGTALDAALAPTMDVDEWMRVFALESLGGLGDGYNRNYDHNLRLYVRPEDIFNKNTVLAFPWDWDNIFRTPTNRSLVGGDNLAKIINRPQNLHHFYGHLQDIIATTFNTTYMSYWTNHYGQIAGKNFGWVLSYIGGRATYVTSQLPPQIPFVVTTNSGNDFPVNSVVATLEGNGWINVRTIRLAGSDTPLEVTWLDQTRWRVTVPVEPGANPLTFEAYNFQGEPVGSDTITVTSTVPKPPLQLYLRVTELMYHPSDPPAGPYEDDDFEFIELKNIGPNTLDLADVAFTDGVNFTFPSDPSAMLAPGGHVIVVSNRAAFSERYETAGLVIAGEYTGRLENAGERLLLVDPQGAPILDFTYDDNGPSWHPETDGNGPSLTIVDELAVVAAWSDPAHWRASFASRGTPGASESDRLPGDADSSGVVDRRDLAILAANFGRTTGAVWASGDFNSDGGVTLADLAIQQSHYGQSISPSPFVASAAATTSIPTLRLRAGRRTAPSSARESVERDSEPAAITAHRRPSAPAVDAVFGRLTR